MFSDRFIKWVILGAIAIMLPAMTLQIVYGGSFGEVRKGDTLNGYWGPTDSSVEWCEENYVSTPYVAELFNSATSFFPFLAGLAFVAMSVSVGAEKRFILLGISVAIIGLGSIAFHGTMQRSMQSLDEVPMVWFVFVLNWTSWEMKNVKGSSNVKAGALFVFLAVLTYFNVFTEGTLAALAFHMSFAPSFIYFIYKTYQLFSTTTNRDTRDILAQAFVWTAVAALGWATDNVMCSILQNLPAGIPNPQLHAWVWHIFVAYGSFLLQLGTLNTRKDVLGQHCTVRHTFFGLIPYLVEVKEDKKVSPIPSAESEERRNSGRRLNLSEGKLWKVTN